MQRLGILGTNRKFFYEMAVYLYIACYTGTYRC